MAVCSIIAIPIDVRHVIAIGLCGLTRHHTLNLVVFHNKVKTRFRVGHRRAVCQNEVLIIPVNHLVLWKDASDEVGHDVWHLIKLFLENLKMSWKTEPCDNHGLATTETHCDFMLMASKGFVEMG
ncbi:hypothetical protein QYF36_021106 [Acer negundo]|nr:hypothetical protein QYF36_021106 [Acer negundo]